MPAPSRQRSKAPARIALLGMAGLASGGFLFGILNGVHGGGAIDSMTSASANSATAASADATTPGDAGTSNSRGSVTKSRQARPKARTKTRSS